MAHEIGHLLSHHNAIIVTELFREILGVDSVSDRKDISDKLTQMLDSIDRDRKASLKADQAISRREEISQYEADRVALYVSGPAGFSPRAYVDLFDRYAKTKERTGNLLANFFRATTSDKRRLREIHKTLRHLPQPCRENVPAASAEFLKWQAAVISYPD
jgi:predicted Zn-dependent protease